MSVRAARRGRFAVPVAGVLMAALSVSCGGPAADKPGTGGSSGVSVTLLVRDGASSQPIPASRWTARLTRAAEAASPGISFRPAGPAEAIAGPVEPDVPYALRVEAAGYQPLVREVRFHAGVRNRLDASLDRTGR